MSGAEFKRFEAAGWDAAASTYDSLTGRATAHAFEPLLDLARVGAGARVLDIACGLGGLSLAARRRGASAVGVDLAPGMLAAARAAHPALELVEGDAEDLPFGDGSFDVALGAFVLNHVPEPERVAREAVRVVAPGGAAGFAVWDLPERARLTSMLAAAVERAGLDRTAGVPDSPDDSRFADPAQLRALLTAAGLAELETRTVDVVVGVGDLDELWDGLNGGTVRTAAAVRAHGPGAEGQIRTALGELAAEFSVPGGYEIPTVIRLATGRRPG